MDMRRVGLAWLTALVVASNFGCKKSDPGDSQAIESPPASVTSAPGDTVARIHWLGKKRVAAGTNAANVMSIWHLPESARLEAQTLDKLALAPWRLLKNDAATNGAPTALLRPLLDDLIQEEFYFEVRELTNQLREVVLAIGLSAERARLWETNLAGVMESLTGVRVTPTEGGWSLRKHEVPNLIQLARAGDWTVVGLAQEHNSLMADMLARIQRDRVPFAAPMTNFWLTLELDLPRATRALSSNWQVPAGWPRVSLSVVGDGVTVRTRGGLSFREPLPFEFSPWNIPTNLIHDPVASFTAVRGIKPWLASLRLWQDSKLGEPPDQMYWWGQPGVPLQTFFSAPFPDASNRVQSVAETLLKSGNAWLATNGMGRLEQPPQEACVAWTGLPFVSPRLRPVVIPGGDFALCSLGPDANSTLPPPGELVQTVLSWTNLLFYQWEITQPRVEALTYILQGFRLIFQKPQLPSDSAGLVWLKTAGPSLGNCITVATADGPNRISFVRQSSIGFSSVELHLLADWLESPQFPRGVHTLLAPPTLRLPRAILPGGEPEKR